MANSSALLAQIEEAFRERQLPAEVARVESCASEIGSDATYFANHNWRNISGEELERRPDCVFGFSAEAFCYFLPGIFCAAVREDKPELIVNTFLITMLDRANIPSSWDDFFLNRWGRLSINECLAAQAWVMWLADRDSPVIAPSSLERSFDTLELLTIRFSAVPLAQMSRRPPK